MWNWQMFPSTEPLPPPMPLPPVPPGGFTYNCKQATVSGADRACQLVFDSVGS